jgi:hypothetical protein
MTISHLEIMTPPPSAASAYLAENASFVDYCYSTLLNNADTFASAHYTLVVTDMHAYFITATTYMHFTLSQASHYFTTCFNDISYHSNTEHIPAYSFTIYIPIGQPPFDLFRRIII